MAHNNDFLTITRICEFLKCADWLSVAAILTPEEEVKNPSPEGCLLFSGCEFGILINPITIKEVNQQTIMTINVNDYLFLDDDKDVKIALVEAGVGVHNLDKKYHLSLQAHSLSYVHYHECNVLSGGACNCEQLCEQYSNAEDDEND